MGIGDVAIFLNADSRYNRAVFATTECLLNWAGNQSR